MPLIVVCGVPSSGKTTRAKEIEEWLKNEQKSVHIVSEDTLLIDKKKAYSSMLLFFLLLVFFLFHSLPFLFSFLSSILIYFIASLLEKNARASLKASVERYLTKDVTVISDSLNCILHNLRNRKKDKTKKDIF